MLEVLPIQTKLEQEAICARCGIEYKVDSSQLPFPLHPAG